MMKKITLVAILAVIATVGFSQKNINIHKNVGPDLKINSTDVDSITFSEFATPGNLIFNTLDTADHVVMEHHAKVAWKGDKYKNLFAPIAGGFNELHCDMKFDEANPENIEFDGSVRLSTCNTFEPGRDDPGHCVNSSLGVTWYTHNDSVITPTDTTITIVYDSAVDANDWATLVCTAGSVVAYGDGGYKAVADFTYRGVTAPVDVYFVFLGTNTYNATSVCHSFVGRFEFQAGATAGSQWYCGSSIKTRVEVEIYMMFQQDNP